MNEVKKISLHTILWFGKYKDKTLKEIINFSPKYIEWCLRKNIFKLKFFAKVYYLKRLKKYNILLNRWQRALLKVEEKYGVWMDDGHGNCGFVKDEEF